MAAYYIQTTHWTDYLSVSYHLWSSLGDSVDSISSAVSKCRTRLRAGNQSEVLSVEDRLHPGVSKIRIRGKVAFEASTLSCAISKPVLQIMYDRRRTLVLSVEYT